MTAPTSSDDDDAHDYQNVFNTGAGDYENHNAPVLNADGSVDF
mgnify:CR=1 FL=1